MLRKTITTAAIALGIGLALPAYAQEDQPDKLPNDRETEELATYIMPIAFRSIATNCAAHLQSDSYLMANAERLQAIFAARAEGTFESVRLPLLRVLIGDQLDEIPPSELVMIEEPMIEGFATNVVNQQLSEAMDAEACTIFNRAMREVAPLPAKSVTSVLGFLIRDMVLARRDES